ncbi:MULTISPECIES: hypothetical protein [Aminobacter]|uniref:Uncharacterized protein n=2 Tax=Aminobacter TaxID=31988 RepID=A0ABR6HEV3_AMIAI|nr:MULTISPECIES: hypothetical protein [Aminobacter]MBA8908687.1 hypothetical protein [Aminobacter ciceronei]MBA9022377.1 hypothetical protein [Aminobacter ciceronei]MBB3708956.1 hypothetical protein [Aminobacter aminovorans]MRX35642.1 hypothetical protein [Aminobacter sp. MDW-2]QNH36266.1 hypothetical protein H5P29_10455 [Aminobacter sp. MDW-2]
MQSVLAIIYHIYTSGYAVGPANGGHARVDANGVTVALADQDRTKCNRSQIDEGLGLIEMAMQRRALGPYQIKAAIAACHVQGEVSHWPQIVLLYDSLLRLEPTAVARLRRRSRCRKRDGRRPHRARSIRSRPNSRTTSPIMRRAPSFCRGRGISAKPR